MNTTHNRKKMIASALGAAAAVVAAPALLFTGAGTAQAETACGDRVWAGPDTSCPFAQNVRDQYVNSGYHEGESAMIDVYSPVTQEAYPMNCVRSGISAITCRGGNNAVVSFITD
jgi:hypothetical protein